MRVGFIGLGNQGGAIARRMLEQGADLVVWARRPEALAPFLAAGAAEAASPAALAEVCDVIGVCVVNDDDVRQMVAGAQGLLAGARPGSVIAVHATVAPRTVIDLEAAARERGVDLLDAPVSGGPKGATAGTMTVMAGGGAEALALARPVFELFATTIPHLGPVGSGQILKLLNNNLCYANAALAVSALEIAAGLGVDPRRAAEIMLASSGSSNGLAIVADPQVLAKAAGPTSNVRKDVGHFLDVVGDRNLADELLARISQLAPEAIEAYARPRG